MTIETNHKADSAPKLLGRLYAAKFNNDGLIIPIRPPRKKSVCCAICGYKEKTAVHIDSWDHTFIPIDSPLVAWKASA
jgi:hypothetical protein